MPSGSLCNLNGSSVQIRMGKSTQGNCTHTCALTAGFARTIKWILILTFPSALTFITDKKKI